MRRILFRFFNVFLCAIFICGCVADEESNRKSKRKAAFGLAQRDKYKVLERYNLELSMTGNRLFVAGKVANLTFTLTNRDSEAVFLPEWYSYEEDNVLLFCQPWLPGMNDPLPDKWIALSFDMHQPPVRYPLELLPGNSVTIEKKLKFVENLVVSPGAERRYFIRADLTLKTVNVSSRVFAVAVRSGAETK